MRQFQIGNHTVKDDDYFLIAELCSNHQGSVDLCCKMMERAKHSGAHAVKLQKREVDTFWSPEDLAKPYNSENAFGATYGEHKHFLEFDEAEWRKVADFAKKTDILLFSTAFDEQSVDFLEEFNFCAYKVASANHTDLELMERLVATKKPLIISVGGGEWADSDELYDYLTINDVHFCFLHCTVSYPTRAEDMNLRIVEELLDRYPDIQIGLSDHYEYSESDTPIKDAYSKGARIFERHFTINRSMKGTDQRFSTDPPHFAMIAHELERQKAMQGDGIKRVLPCEVPNIQKMKKWREKV